MSKTLYTICAVMWAFASGLQFYAGNPALGTLNLSLTALYICLANMSSEEENEETNEENV